MCVLIFSTTFVWNISHFKNWLIYDQEWISVPLFLSDFNQNLIIFYRFPKNIQILNFIDNPSSGSRVAQRGRTDMTKKMAVFRNFANRPKTAWGRKLLCTELPLRYHLCCWVPQKVTFFSLPHINASTLRNGRSMTSDVCLHAYRRKKQLDVRVLRQAAVCAVDIKYRKKCTAMD